MPHLLSSVFHAAAFTVALMAGSGLAQTLDNVTYKVPAGWQEHQEGDAIVLTPPALESKTVNIKVFSPVPAPPDPQAWFEEYIRKDSQNLRDPQTQYLEAQPDPDGTLNFAAFIYEKSSKIIFIAADTHKNYTYPLKMTFGNKADSGKYGQILESFVKSFNITDGKVKTSAKLSNAPTQPASNLTISPMNAAQFLAKGHDPETELIPDEFVCYVEGQTDQTLSPSLFIQILSENRYRVLQKNRVQLGGIGQYSHYSEYDSSNIKWSGGPLAGDNHSSVELSEYGQYIYMDHEALGRKFLCHQRGAKNEHERWRMSLRIPRVGKYHCDNKTTAEILPGNRYRVNGQEGTYTIDVLPDSVADLSDLVFSGGAWNGESVFYEEEETGLHQWSKSNSKVPTCSLVTKPSIPPSPYSKAKAPPPPRGTGGLTGKYTVGWVDSTGYCSGMCWYYYIFDEKGYVFTNEIKTSLNEADCSRTYANGLPVCKTYTYQKGILKIAGEESKSFKKNPDGTARYGDEDLSPILPVDGIKIEGKYTSLSYASSFGGLSSVTSVSEFIYKKDGTFRAEHANSVNSRTTDTGTPTGDTTSSIAASGGGKNSGKYRFYGNTLELTYADGSIKRMFTFFPIFENGKRKMNYFHAGDRDYYDETFLR